MTIKSSLNAFINGKNKNKGKAPNERYSSFDYCYNYFYSFYKKGNTKALADKSNLQMSCFQIGFYLASWGMLRGSSFLLEKSARHYKELIKTIATINPKIWEIDVDSYSDENITLILNCREKIAAALGATRKPSDTLTTKIMLGVFANIPAFDQYFRKSLQVHSVDKKSLNKIKDFYEWNKDIFDSYKLYTFDFLTGKETKVRYTKVKLIDMYGFIAGQG